MKTPIRTPRPQEIVISLLTACLLCLGAGLAHAQQIDARALTPQEIRDYGLPEETLPSGGVLVVGIGEPVYLSAHVPKGTVVNGVTWSIENRPLGGSVAELLPTPITEEMPIYSPGDREVMDVAGRILFIPDIPGKYIIKAVIATDGDPIEVEEQVTGALYTGVGTIAGASPEYPQCALCHEENSIGWMETAHSDYFKRAIDGQVSSHYNESCVRCHALGKGEMDVAGGFYTVASEVGWIFPETLEPGNWDAMPAELKAMANIQCEHCHGAGSEHHGDKTTTAVTLSAGDCAQCHDNEPYYIQGNQWSNSGHAVVTRYPTGEGREHCVNCHSGIGFIDMVNGAEELSTDYEAVTCAVCHDPHGSGNRADLRTMENVVLENGMEVTAGGTGKLCMNCHKSRRDADEYVKQYARHYGPHYSAQTDMLVGTNAVEYDMVMDSTAHIHALDDACATCHMHDLPMDDPSRNFVGGHTFKPIFDNNTPDDPSDDVDMVGACVDCHGPMESFDIAASDYNYDGIVEGVKTEIGHLMHALAMKLPPIGEPTVEVAEDYTPAQLKAAFNYQFVYQDGSHGIHNPAYASGILQAAINNLADPFNAIFGGLNIPIGGEWFYSTWFKFYSPGTADGWIYHYEHGHLYVSGDANTIWLYENRTGLWRYTTPETYPVMFDPASNAWLYYAGVQKWDRYFYNYSTGEWIVIR